MQALYNGLQYFYLLEGFMPVPVPHTSFKGGPREGEGKREAGWEARQKRGKFGLLFKKHFVLIFQVRERSVEEPPPVATKSLEELFKKTTAGPAIYWRPLSEEEIQAKIDEKKKKVDEAKSQK